MDWGSLRSTLHETSSSVLYVLKMHFQMRPGHDLSYTHAMFWSFLHPSIIKKLSLLTSSPHFGQANIFPVFIRSWISLPHSGHNKCSPFGNKFCGNSSLSHSGQGNEGMAYLLSIIGKRLYAPNDF